MKNFDGTARHISF